MNYLIQFSPRPRPRLPPLANLSGGPSKFGGPSNGGPYSDPKPSGPSIIRSGGGLKASSTYGGPILIVKTSDATNPHI